MLRWTVSVWDLCSPNVSNVVADPFITAGILHLHYAQFRQEAKPVVMLTFDSTVSVTSNVQDK